jgi:hypothetical protein
VAQDARARAEIEAERRSHRREIVPLNQAPVIYRDQRRSW